MSCLYVCRVQPQGCQEIAQAEHLTVITQLPFLRSATSIFKLVPSHLGQEIRYMPAHSFSYGGSCTKSRSRQYQAVLDGMYNVPASQGLFHCPVVDITYILT